MGSQQRSRCWAPLAAAHDVGELRALQCGPVHGAARRLDGRGIPPAEIGLLTKWVSSDYQADRVARGVVLARLLVGGLDELADQLLEQVPHVGVGRSAGVQVDLGERSDDQEEAVLLVELGDLGLEAEPLEHVDVGREAVHVVDQVGAQALRIGQQSTAVER